MTSITTTFVILAISVAVGLGWFQYLFKSTVSRKLKYILFALRMLVWLMVFLLLINPEFEKIEVFNQKPKLLIAADNSQSISYLKQNKNAKQIINQIKNNSKLNSKFDAVQYAFGASVTPSDSLIFKQKQSNISEVIDYLNTVYSNETFPIVLVTDGNQTIGSDYSYTASKLPVYPIILGDSIKYTDLSIKQVNVNRYAFLKNKFPIEIISNYTGTKNLKTVLNIYEDKKLIYSNIINFNSGNTSNVTTAIINPERVGVNTYKIELSPLNEEKNKANNVKHIAVEVIDQKINIALVSDIVHPDLGAIKKSIESNEQRRIFILKPAEFISNFKDYQLAIIYQPNRNFSSVYDVVKKHNFNTLTVCGTTTDWNFLNNSQNNFKHTITKQTEEYQPHLNNNFNTFIINNIDFKDFPPLKTTFGKLSINSAHNTLLYKTINGILTEEPLLAILEDGSFKHGILNGEGIWKWRAQSFFNSNSFNAFDTFINKLVQFLSTNKARKRLNLDYESFYSGNEAVVIAAQYFNKNFEFDSNASLSIKLFNKATSKTINLPLLFNGYNYTVDLSNLIAGQYQFTVSNASKTVNASGVFKILEYNVEQQFLNANSEKLQLLAQNTNGHSAYFNNANGLLNKILNDKRFATIQKSNKNIVPLVDWKYLLFLIALCLALEWFIRKYNGLI